MAIDIPYKEENGFLVPDIEFPPQPEGEIGYFGRRRREYLREHDRRMYHYLQWNMEMKAHLLEIQEQAELRMETLIKQMKEERGVTEELKAKDQMGWVSKMTAIREEASEIVLKEIIYV